MTIRLRRRIFFATTVTTSGVVLAAAILVYLATSTVTYQALDKTVLVRHRLITAFPGNHPGPGPGQGPDQGLPPRPPGDDHPHWPTADGRPPRPPARPERANEHPPRPGPPEYAASGGTMVVQIIGLPSRREIARSPSLAEGISLDDAFSAEVADEQPIDVRGADGRWLRVMRSRMQAAIPIDLPPWLGQASAQRDMPPGEKREVMVMSGVDATAAHHDLGFLALMLVALWLVATLLSWLVSAWLRQALLGPITRISELIAAIEPEQLSARIPTTAVPQEMQVVLTRLTTLMAKLDAAFTRERTTIANIAHELRTPIAGLRATLEFALARGPHASRDEDLHDCLRMTQEMQGMIVNLLMLARVEAGQARLAAQAVELRALAERALAPLAERLRGRELTVDNRIAGGLAAFAAEEHLLIVFANILDNAASYAISGQAIAITGTDRDGWVEIEISNATDGTLRDVSEIFTPFWRGEAARTAGTHCGLGLTLVQRLVNLAGGAVSARIEGLNLFRLIVRLPLPPTPRGAGAASAPAPARAPGE